MQMSDEQYTMLRILARRGMMRLSRVLAETMMLPGNLLKLLQNLALAQASRVLVSP
jgi:hypothetical protein